MRRSAAAALVAAAVVVMLVSCGGPTPSPVVVTGERGALELRAELRRDVGSLFIDVVVRNTGSVPVHLVPDQCGRVTEALLVRTRFEPEGESWTGSLQAVKDLILDDQLSRQSPDRFHPRIPGDRSATTPTCSRPDAPVAIPAGGQVAERWELPLTFTPALDAVGSDGSAIRIEIVEARAPDALEYLDIIQAGQADELRAGRNLRLERPTSVLLDRAPTSPATGPSLGELYDALLETAELRDWIEAQPADSWRLATLRPAYPEMDDPDLEHVLLELVTTTYERAAHVQAEPDGSGVVVDLPAADDRLRPFARRAATMPPGIALIDEPDGYTPSADLLLGEVVLPSGRLVVGEYLLDDEGLSAAIIVPPGSYPVHATLATYLDEEWDRTAFGTLVVSDQATVRWEEAGAVAVDGGSTSMVSIEGVRALTETFERSEDEWWAEQDVLFESLAAHDFLATLLPLDDEVNIAHFTSGNGDGGYPVFVGYDANDRPTRVVVDFLLLHLDWPMD